MVDYRGMELDLADGSEAAEYLQQVSSRRSFVLQACLDCGRLRYPPGAACPYCASSESEWRSADAAGTIISYTIVHQAIQPGFREWVPYPVVVGELDEQKGVPGPDDGIRLVANLLRADFTPEVPSSVAIGLRVEVVLQDIGDGLLLPQLCLTQEQPEEEPWPMA